MTTLSDLLAEIAIQFPDNNAGQISAARLRTVASDIASFVQDRFPLSPDDFGTLYGDGQQATYTVTVANGGTALAATGASFSSADVGKIIRIATSGGTLASTIASVSSGTQVTLSSGSPIALTSSSVMVFWGHDDAPAIQAAVNSGKAIYLHSPGTYWLGSTLIFGAAATLIGDSLNLITLKLMPGVNADVIASTGCYSLFGTGSTASIDGWDIEGITLDGNSANQYPSNPDTCNGIAFYSAGFTFRNIQIQNVKGHGIRSGYQPYGPGGGTLEFVTTLTVGRHGWYHAGPHDVSAIQVISVDSSQEADNTYYGTFLTLTGTGVFLECHNWHNAWVNNRVKYQLYSGIGGAVFQNCQYEGGRGQIYHAGNGDLFVGGKAYAPFGLSGSALVVFGGNANQHVGSSYVITHGQPFYGVKLGDTSSVTNNQIVGGFFQGFDNLGAFNFANDGGYNLILATGSAAAGGVTTVTGAINSYSHIWYFQSGTGIAMQPASATVAQTSDGTTNGGNARGTGAVDFQTTRDAASQVAAGMNSFIGGGNRNTVGTNAANSAIVSGQSSSVGSAANAFIGGGLTNFAIGYNSAVVCGTSNNASGSSAFIGGGQNNVADGEGSVIPGGYNAAVRSTYGKHAFASGAFSVRGDAQIGAHVLRASTTDATPTRLTSDGAAAAGSANSVPLPNSGLYAIIGRVVARNTSTGDAAHFEIKGTLKRGANAAATAIVGTSIITVVAGDSGATWATTSALALSADTTNGSVSLTATGAASTSIHWVAKVETVEVS